MAKAARLGSVPLMRLLVTERGGPTDERVWLGGVAAGAAQLLAWLQETCLPPVSRGGVP